MQKHTTIAIIGGGFAGLAALLVLRKRLGKSAKIKLFEERSHFCHIPALHEAILAPRSRLAMMQLSYKKRYPDEYIQTRVERIESHQLTTSHKQRRSFDYAIIATGSRTHMFENPEREKNSYTVRYADDIPRLNQKLKDPKTKTIVVIGGGYTGVEIVATIAVRKRRDQTLMLIHGKERLFDRLGPHISDISLQRLRRHGVEVMLDQKVTDILPDHIQLASGETIPSDMTIVSRGIRVNDESFHANLSFEESYQAKDAHHIYLCGDVAKHGLIATAHNAMFEGRRTAHLMADQLQGVTNSYPPLQNRDKLAIALGPYDGILTNGKKGLYIPRFVGFAKRIVERRVLFEYAYKVMLWI